MVETILGRSTQKRPPVPRRQENTHKYDLQLKHSMHVAIIPDGNRRWAKEKGLAATKGHEQGGDVDRLESLLKKALELKITRLSLWLFSTDNWKRSRPEKEALFSLLNERLEDLQKIALEQNLRVLWVGRRTKIDAALRERLEIIEEETKNNTQLIVQLCLDYGGREEILEAVNKAIKQGEEQDEKSFASLLQSPDADLIIRTSGEQRLSGFLPWQSTYAELYFFEKHFPDFGPEDLAHAVNDFSSRNRRFGGE